MADTWILVVDEEVPSALSHQHGVMLGSYDPRGDGGYSGYSLRRGGLGDEEILVVEARAEKAAKERGEKYKPLVWRIPLYFGDELRKARSWFGAIVRRPSSVCLKFEGRYVTKKKDGKRERVYKKFREPLYQPLEDPRLLGRGKLRKVEPPKKAKDGKKVAA